jgi:hypothetical protein
VLPGARIERCSLADGKLDIVIPTNETHAYRFVLQDGQLWTTNPDDDEIETMLQVARRLNARVRGDELETFSSVRETYVHPDDAPLLRDIKERSHRTTARARTISWVIKVGALTVLLIGIIVSLLRL